MTDDERREVAAKLRELAQESARCGDDGVGKRACRVLLGPRVDLLDVVDAHFPLAHLADLIEPEERRCRVVTDIRAFSQTQDMHVKSCSACGYVFGSERHCQLLPGIDKRVAIKSVVIPNYCPNCGAKVLQE